MNKTSKTTPTSGTKVVFFGNERIATGVTTDCPTLQKLIRSGFNVVAVVVHHEAKASRKQKTLKIADLAAKYEIPLLSPSKPSDIEDVLNELKPDVGVLVAYGKIVPESTIALFPAGIVNIHPSLLPQHRGSAPIESIMLNGSKKTGVSLMRLAKKMDAGDVYAYSEYELYGTETKQALADELLELGSEMLIAILPRIVSGEITGKVQIENHATYDSFLAKQDGVFDLSKSAVQLEREVRAYLVWPGSRTVIAGKDVVITAARVADNSLDNVDNLTIFVANKQLCLQTADGILVIDELKPASKPAMSSTAFLAGYGHRL